MGLAPNGGPTTQANKLSRVYFATITCWRFSSLPCANHTTSKRTQTAAAFLSRIFAEYYHDAEFTPITPIAASARSASTSSTNIHGFPCFPLAFPDGNGLAAQLHKQSPVGTTRQLLCSRAAIPCRRHFLEKVRKNGIFVVFLRKEKTKSFEASAKNTAGPAAETAS